MKTGPATCKSDKCKAPIVFAHTNGGKSLPYDAKPAPGGVWSIDVSGETATAKYVKKEDRQQAELTPLYHWPHWATCKDPDAFRGGKGKKETTGGEQRSF